jgi:ribose transport system permease protein
VAGEIGSGHRVVILAGMGEENAIFVQALAAQLEADGSAVVARVNGSPAEARAALESVVKSGGKVDQIATSSEAAMWPFVKNLAAQFPSFGSAKVVSPKVYRWPTFLNQENILNIASQVVVISLLAVGMTMVIITGGIDLSVGSLVALSAVVCSYRIRASGGVDAGTGAMIASAAMGVGICALLGLVSGAFITTFKLPAFIATLGMMQIASGVAKIVSKGESIYSIPDTFTSLGRGAGVFGIPNAVLLMVFVYLIAHVAMSKTTFGRYVYATGGNMEAARLSGVRTNMIQLLVYTISGAMAGLGGIVVTSQLKAGAPTYGLMYELYAIAAVVVGGTSLIGGSGKILGTLIGALIIAVIQNGMNLTGIQSYTQQVVLGLVILAAVTIDMVRRRGWSLFHR